MRTRKIAITGGTGFVGRNIARSLASEGHELVLVIIEATMNSLAGLIFQVLMKTRENIGAVSHLSDAQSVTETPSSVDCALMSHDVSQFVRQNSREFVVAASENNHLARNIHAAAGDAEGVHIREVNQIETKLHLGGRRMFKKKITECIQVLEEDIIIDDDR